MVAQVGVARALGQGQAGTRQGSHVSLWLLSTPPICPSRCHVHLFRLSKIRRHLELSRRNRRQLSLHLTRERKTLLLSNNTLPMDLMPTGVAFSPWTHVFLPQISDSSFTPLSTLSGVLGSQTHLSSDNKTQQPTRYSGIHLTFRFRPQLQSKDWRKMGPVLSPDCSPTMQLPSAGCCCISLGLGPHWLLDKPRLYRTYILAWLPLWPPCFREKQLPSLPNRPTVFSNPTSTCLSSQPGSRLDRG